MLKYKTAKIRQSKTTTTKPQNNKLPNKEHYILNTTEKSIPFQMYRETIAPICLHKQFIPPAVIS